MRGIIYSYPTKIPLFMILYTASLRSPLFKIRAGIPQGSIYHQISIIPLSTQSSTDILYSKNTLITAYAEVAVTFDSNSNSTAASKNLQLISN